MIPDHQLTLPLAPPPADENTPLVPARMVNEWVYCPRLAYLEWVEGEWAESGDTAEGRRTHGRDDRQLLSIEGEAAAVYFACFEHMLAEGARENVPAFAFAKRNRRPPTDPVNAMLSLAYALLTRVFTTAISATGLDPYMGFYHRPRHGRPALALDLMEPFRPIVADSCVI